MSALRDAFNLGAGVGEDAVLSSPGSSGLLVLFSSANMDVNVENIDRIYSEMEWPEDYSFTWDEVRNLAMRLGWLKETDRTQVDSDDDDESNTFGALADTIAQRAERKEFPLIYPSELAPCACKTDAEDIVRLCKHVEATKLQAYIDFHWHKCMDENSDDAKLPIPLKYAQWIREHYYRLCRFVLAVESLRRRRFLHSFDAGVFLPLIPSLSIEDTTMQGEAQECVQKMTLTLLASVDANLWKKWEDIKKLFSYFGKPIEDVFRSFLSREYISYACCSRQGNFTRRRSRVLSF